MYHTRPVGLQECVIVHYTCRSSGVYRRSIGHNSTWYIVCVMLSAKHVDLVVCTGGVLRDSWGTTLILYVRCLNVLY